MAPNYEKLLLVGWLCDDIEMLAVAVPATRIGNFIGGTTTPPFCRLEFKIHNGEKIRLHCQAMIAVERLSTERTTLTGPGTVLKPGAEFVLRHAEADYARLLGVSFRVHA